MCITGANNWYVIYWGTLWEKYVYHERKITVQCLKNYDSIGKSEHSIVGVLALWFIFMTTFVV